MRETILLCLVMMLAGCAGTNQVTTETFFDERGEPYKTVVTQKLSDDGMYYQEAARAVSAGAAGTCAPNCAPGELASIEAFRTIRALTGGAFVERGMSGVEAATSVAGAIISQSPAYMLGLGLYKALDRPASVNLNGDGNMYSPAEWHWTGNRMQDGNSFPSTYRYQSPDPVTTTTEVIP